MIRNAPNSSRARAAHIQSGNMAMARSSVSLASGLSHLFNLGKDPLGRFRNAATRTEVLGDQNTCQSVGGETDNNLDRQAVEQELWRYEEDGLVDVESLVAFWEVLMAILSMRDFSCSHGLCYRNMNMFTQCFSTLQWTYYQLKQLLFLVKGCFRPARKHARYVAASLAQPQLRCFKS